jgi:hypothetical protein
LFLKWAGLDTQNPKHLSQIRDLLGDEAESSSLVKQLETHPLFQKIICGHPMLIEIVSSRIKSHSLQEVYKILSQERCSTNPVLRSFQVFLSEIKAQKPDSIRLYSLISLMPTGVQDQDI